MQPGLPTPLASLGLAGASTVRRGAWGLSRIVGGRVELQRLADRLDPEAVPVGVDVGHYFLGRRSCGESPGLAFCDQ